MEQSILQYITLGIVQGLTELLPISSTAHLALVPWFLGWQDPGLSLTVALHGGTLLAVLIYFWRDWLAIFKEGRFFLLREVGRTDPPPAARMLVLLIVATIP